MKHSLSRMITLVALMLVVNLAVAADFSYRNNYGLTGITIDGQNLLLVNGFHIIGSKSGADNDDNINSESPYNTAGVMRSRNPNGGTLPFSMTFTPSNTDPNRIDFAVSVGASNDTFRSLSIPLECKMQYFNYWRSSDSTSLKRYDQNQFLYEIPSIGRYYIDFAPGNSQWGEIIGPRYTIRVTIRTNSRACPPGFVNSPGLASGDRDVEFGFNGGLPARQRASITGYIQVSRTDQNIISGKTFQTESSPFHQTGRREGDGWSVTTRDPSRVYLNYGPYDTVAAWGGQPKGSTTLPAGQHSATFKILLDNVSANNNRILTVDVFDANSGRIIATQDLTRRMFDAANRYKSFVLHFDSVPGQRLEFRTFYWGGSYVRQDSVTVR